MLTSAPLGWQTDTPTGRLAARAPSASEGIAAELEMSRKCDKGISAFTLPLTSPGIKEDTAKPRY